MLYRVLGQLDVEDGNRRLDLGRPKQRAVLAVLLVEANHVVSLDRLIDLVWGHQPPARSAASLQVYISNLRRALEPDRAARQTAHRLVSDAPGYRIVVGPDELDAWQFEKLAVQGRRLLAEGRPADARDTLNRALRWWRGEALSEFTYEAFARPWADRWEELRLLATEDRIEAELAIGAHAEAVADLEALVVRFPFRERLWGLLMVGLYRCGRQADALRAFSAARAKLREELGIDPGPDLVRLEAEILAQAPTLGWRPAGELPTLPLGGPDEMVSADRKPAERRAIVGRAPEVQALDVALAEARGGAGRVVLIAGEPGIGKTRLAEELCRRAALRRVAVAWGTGFDGDGPALWPWVQVLRTVLPSAGAERVRAAVGSGAAWLAQLVPEAADVLGSPEPPPPLDAETARFRLSEAVIATLTAICAEEALVVVLDDVHWADPATLALAELLAGRIGGSRLLLACTFRTDELSAEHPLAATLAGLARQARVARITLKGLDRGAVAELVGFAGVAPTAALVGALHARTDGNPFYLTELLKLLASEGRLDSIDAAAARIPEGVLDVIRRRLARLPSATNELLRVAAVAGREFDLDIVAVAADQDEEKALGAAELAVLAGIVSETDGSVGRFTFSHALVRDAIYGDLSALRRARLHARVGAALERGPHPERAVFDLAHHFFEGRHVAGLERALSYAFQASELAQATLATEQAEAHLGRALRAVEELPPGPDRDRDELRVQNRLAVSLFLKGSAAAAEYERAFDRAAGLALGLGLVREMLASTSGLATAATVRAEWGAVTGLGERMLAMGEASSDDLCVAAGLFAVGNADLFTGRLASARQRIGQAVAVARTLHQPSPDIAFIMTNPIVLALSMQAILHSLVGETEEAELTTQEAGTRAAALGFPFWSASVLWLKSMRLACENRPAIAADLARRCAAVCTENGLDDLAVLASVLHAWGSADHRPDDADIDRLGAAVSDCEARGFRIMRGLQLGLLSDLLTRAGRWPEAQRAAEDGLDSCLATGERFIEAELHRLRGEALLARGRRFEEQAMASIRRAIAVADEQGAVLFRGRAEESLRRIAVDAHL